MENKGKSKTKIIINYLAFIVIDVLAVAIAWIIGIILTGNYLSDCFDSVLFLGCFVGAVVLFVVSNHYFGLYSNILRYVGLYDAVKIGASLFISAFYGLICTIFLDVLPITWFVVSSLILAIELFFTRFIYRIFGIFEGVAKSVESRKNGTKTLIVGAGDAGSILVREIKHSDKLSVNPVCIIDDDPAKRGMEICGVKVVGTVNDIPEVVQKYGVEEIVVAMPSVNKKRIAEILEVCQKTDCKTKLIPGVYEMVTGAISFSSVKDVDVADLLGREPVKVNLRDIMEYIHGKTVMVTGGGGSIGSELCRQIAKSRPKTLIILDMYENNAYDIQQELLHDYSTLDLKVLIASVRDEKRLETVFEQLRPQIVFHAAAHKHVPLMEDSPNEAVKNNIGGTYKTADVAGRFGVEKFILISTDKAVNPTNVMGATKRICEMIIQSMNKKYDTDYVAVRFGNVLGSNGSVVPLFKKQIEAGGPLTVTDENIVRYFMTIPEAVSLVLQAGAFATGGEIFVLDMGEPVRIFDMAVNMIKLSGLTPFEDIDIKITGLRPGEKLYEERLMSEEGLTKTSNDMISVGKPLEFDEKSFFANVKNLIDEAYCETDKIKESIAKIVPTYTIKKNRTAPSEK